MMKKTTNTESPNKAMKKAVVLFSSVLVLVGCSTTNRQIIIECEGRDCKSIVPKANVVAMMSSDSSNMVITNSAVVKYPR